MIDLADVTTDEMFDELSKRNDGVIVAAWRFLGADKRCAHYTNWAGSRIVLAGLMKHIERELELAWHSTDGEAVDDDDDE